MPPEEEDPNAGADTDRGTTVDDIVGNDEPISSVPGGVSEEDLRALTSTTETVGDEGAAASPAGDDPTRAPGKPADPPGSAAEEPGEPGEKQAPTGEDPLSDPVAYYQTPEGARQAHRALQMTQDRIRDLEQRLRHGDPTPDQEAPQQPGSPREPDHPEHPAFQRYYQQALALQEEHEHLLSNARGADNPEAEVARVEHAMAQKWSQIPQAHLEAIREHHARRQERLADPDRFYVTREELDTYLDDRIRSHVERAQRSHRERELMREHAELLARDPALLRDVDRALNGQMQPHEVANLLLKSRTSGQALSEVSSRTAHAAGQAALKRETAASTQRRPSAPQNVDAEQAFADAREELKRRGIPEDSPAGVAMVERALEQALGA